VRVKVGRVLLAAATVLGAAVATARVLEAAPPQRARFTRVVGGLDAPVLVTNAGDGSNRLFVLEQAGRIRIVRGEPAKLVERPFLDISELVRSGGEMGLLGLAFHPHYRENGRFFIDYTRGARRHLETVIAEYHVSPDDPDVALPAEKPLLTIDQPYENHNGGQVVFGPDGFLYVGMGDGGAANDPHENGQDRTQLLAKILRIDVDHEADGKPYAIPADNPFAKGGGRGEIFAWGMRNPWRFSFDRGAPARGVFVGDVGQDTWEEVDLVQKGDDCGWNVLEGTHDFRPHPGVDRSTLRMPIAEYSHSEGQSVTGGFVYRGHACPDLVGAYVFSDFYPGPLWALVEATDAPGTWTRQEIGAHRFQLSSFGEDEAGELYAVDYGGAILRLAPPEIR
jgi:glucose/arabinose dehydrogenase